MDPSRFDAKVIRLPSGAQTGKMLALPSTVSCRPLPATKSYIHTSRLPLSERVTTAKDDPLGDTRGYQYGRGSSGMTVVRPSRSTQTN